MSKLGMDVLKFVFGSLVGMFFLLTIAAIHTDILTAPPSSLPLPLYSAPSDIMDDWRQQECKGHAQCRKLAEAIFFEGRGESEVGRYAIAFTVINRRDSKRWPSTVYAVVEQRIKGVCQFSYICQFREEKRKKILAQEPKAWHDALEVAYKVYHFEAEDPTKGEELHRGATHYHATYVSPYWSKKLETITQIGNHIFYRG